MQVVQPELNGNWAALQEIALKWVVDFAKFDLEKPKSKTMPRTASAAESITRL